MRKLVAIILAISVSLTLAPMASAANTDELVAANALCGLGLFKGIGTDEQGNPIFALDKALNRNEAVTMLIRLLGKETAAIKGTGMWTFPFDDVDEWVSPYVGCAYENGFTTGISATKYSGKAAVTATQYLTFVLRALGYDDKKGDFSWDKAWILSDKLGITNGEYNVKNNALFTRGDAVKISYNALKCNLADNTVTLLSKLHYEYAITLEAIREAELDEFLTIFVGNRNQATGIFHKAIIDGKLYHFKWTDEVDDSDGPGYWGGTIRWDVDDTKEIFFQGGTGNLAGNLLFALLTNTFVRSGDYILVYDTIYAPTLFKENLYRPGLVLTYKSKALDYPYVQDAYGMINGVRYSNELVSVNDLCEYFGIHANISLKIDPNPSDSDWGKRAKYILVVDYT